MSRGFDRVIRMELDSPMFSYAVMRGPTMDILQLCDPDANLTDNERWISTKGIRVEVIRHYILLNARNMLGRIHDIPPTYTAKIKCEVIMVSGYPYLAFTFGDSDFKYSLCWSFDGRMLNAVDYRVTMIEYDGDTASATEAARCYKLDPSERRSLITTPSNFNLSHFLRSELTGFSSKPTFSDILDMDA